MKIDPAAFRILVVDDDPTTLVAVASILRGEGYRVAEMDDPMEASERIGQEPFDVLIADYKMPEVDGLGLVRRARLLRPDSIRMILAGEGDYEVAVLAIHQGEVYRFMTKPVDEVDLRVNTRLACEHLTLVREVHRLRARVRDDEALLERLERENPDIIRLNRRDDGSIVADDEDVGSGDG
ncbi:MAG: response regulator [Myxococcota bacterium]